MSSPDPILIPSEISMGLGSILAGLAALPGSIPPSGCSARAAAVLCSACFVFASALHTLISPPSASQLDKGSLFLSG